MIGKLIIMA